MAERKITVIPAKREYARADKSEIKRLNVAAYCRVSTLQEQQETSYEAQITHYIKLIHENPLWNLAGIYADDGKTATNTKKRNDFNAMIDRCLNKKGEIDLIITKSISRFARNTVDCLMYIRKLKEKNIAVFFEKEGINTLEASGELLITILSSQAQEESRNISENVKWGLKRKYEAGVVLTRRLLGYRSEKNGSLVIVPEEAEIVRFIFSQYLSGDSLAVIAEKLEQKGIKTMRGNDKWNQGSIKKILNNEKYIGDTLAQKTYTVNYLSKERKENKGELAQYYTENSHEAIIPREIFYRVQEEMSRRANMWRLSTGKKNKECKGRHSGKYALTEILVCGECGRPYRRQIWSKYGEKKAVWRCENRLRDGTKYCRNSPTISEEALHETIMNAINNVLSDRETFINSFRENVLRVVITGSKEDTPTEYDKEIEKLKEQMMRLIKINAMNGSSIAEYEDEYKIISERLEELEILKIKELNARKITGGAGSKADQINRFLKNPSCILNEYDDKLVRELIRSITVINEARIDIYFKSGITIEKKIG